MSRQPSELICDRYQIQHLLGSGSTGSTYTATNLETGQQVAIKELELLGMKDWKILELFEREAKVLSTLNHPAIPQYLDYFQVDTPENHYFYLVQALAPGKSLASLVAEQGKLEEIQVIAIATQILYILEYLQSFNPPIIHRDIKPQNLIYSPEGTIYLVDFGSVQNVYRCTLTQGSTVVGTYGYMSPEQFRGKAYISSDLYGLGATLLYLLTAKSPGDLPQRRLKVNFRPFVEITPNFADWLETMLEAAPEDRFSSAELALLALNSESNNPKPQQSAIAYKKNIERLSFKIPFLSLKLALAFVILTTFLTALLVTFPILLISLPFLIFWLRDKFVAQIYLEIDRYKFRIQWQWLGLSYSREGKTANLDRIEVNTRYSLNGNIIHACNLVAGVHSYRFAEAISLSEKNWIVAEINAFLAKLR